MRSRTICWRPTFRSRTRATPGSSWRSPRPPPAGASAGSAASSAWSSPSVRPRRCGCCATSRRDATQGPQPGARDLLEPRRDLLGRQAGGALSACGRLQVRRRAPNRLGDRSRPTCRQSLRSGSRPAISASSCASSASSTSIDADRGHRRRVDRDASRRRCKVAELSIAQGQGRRGRGDRGCAPHRRTRLQPVEHHRRSSARSATSTGRARPPTTPARPIACSYRWQTPVPLRNRLLGRLRAGLPRHQPLCRVAPAAGAARPAQPRRLPLRAAREEPDRHRCRRGAARARPVPPSTDRRRRAAGAHL